MRRARGWSCLAAVLGATVFLAGCGEPDVGVEVPRRGPGQHVLDTAGVLDAGVEERLAELSASSDLDVVALAFEDERASLGQADRGGRLLLAGWDADVVLVAVAFPGHFTEPDPEQRRRFFGVYADRFDVSRDLRARVVEDAVPPPAARNDWPAAFQAAIDELETDLAAPEV